tara:strand:- start:50 stop:274 length:225 start_codon:yes stop_codon:yes gene_type:complete
MQNTKIIIVQNIIEKYLKCKITKNASQENTPQWDSLNYLLICSELEKKFKIKISSKNINKFNSFKAILKILKIS